MHCILDFSLFVKSSGERLVILFGKLRTEHVLAHAIDDTPFELGLRQRQPRKDVRPKVCLAARIVNPRAIE
jgi:hypothetical protein